MNASRLLLCTLVFGLLAAPALAQPSSPDAQSAPEATKIIRDHYMRRAHERGHARGKKLLDRFEDAPELRAWTLMNATKDGRIDYARSEAEAMTEAQPENPWGWIALAHVLSRNGSPHYERALEASRKALALAPDDADVIWARALTLYRTGEREEAIDFVDAHRGDVENPAPLLVVKSLSQRYRDGADEGDIEASYEPLAKARVADSTNLNAQYVPGYYLLREEGAEAAYPFLKRSAELAPGVLPIHRNYWRAAMRSDGASQEEKRAEVAADVERFLDARADSADVLFQAARQYSALDMDEKQRRVEERILQQAPATEEAEWVLVNRYRQFREKMGREGMNDPEQRATFRRMLRDFIDYPHHPYDDGALLGDAYRNLFYLARNDSLSTFTDRKLLEIANGLAEHEDNNPHITYAANAILLAERTDHYERATEIARQGIGAIREDVLEARERGRFDTEKEFTRSLGGATSLMYDALGWAYFQQGEMARAEQALRRAHGLNDDNADNLYHLGRLYERLGMMDEAEGYYVAGAAVQGMGENPNEDALRDLYRTRNGSLDGFEAYRAKLREDAAAERKQKILAARLDSTRALPPFDLKTLSSERDSLSSTEALAGDEVAIINVWGKWCGPCVREMPAIQKLYDRYRDDPDVTVLTINNDPNPDAVRTWMKKRDFDFPVLLDDGYLSDNDVHAFPTTWFVTPGGQIAFAKEGYTKKLVQEFGWRAQALRE